MSIFLFIIIHIFIGLILIFFHGKLPKALTVLTSVLFMMSIFYWGTVIVYSLSS